MASTSIALEYTEDRAEELRENIESVLKKVEQAAGSDARPSGLQAPRLVAVSKLKPASDIQALYDAGYRHFGENYIQEMVDKAEVLPKDIKWHFIGNLQSNKAKVAAAIPNLFLLETLSSIKTADLLNRARSDLPPLNVYIQINTSSEDAKSGVPPLISTADTPSSSSAVASESSNEAVQLATHILEKCPNLHLTGLMTIGSFTASHDTSKPNPDVTCLKNTRKELHRILKSKDVTSIPDSEDGWELSMGMSADFVQAIKEGSSSVRVGTKIFGERPKKVKAGDGGGVTK